MFDLDTETRLLNLVTIVVACAAIAIVVYRFLRGRRKPKGGSRRTRDE